MVLWCRISPLGLREPAEARMLGHSGITGTWASEVARKAHLGVIWVDIFQVKSCNNTGIVLKSLRPPTRRMAAHTTTTKTN